MIMQHTHSVVLKGNMLFILSLRLLVLQAKLEVIIQMVAMITKGVLSNGRGDSPHCTEEQANLTSSLFLLHSILHPTDLPRDTGSRVKLTSMIL